MRMITHNPLQDTITEKYLLKQSLLKNPVEHPVYYVKREDLACKPPGPPFAKVRGLWAGLLDLYKQGVREVGYFDTSISMASWGISCFCDFLGMKAVIFRYEYKGGLKDNQPMQNEVWKKFGPEIHINKKPNMQKLHEAVSRKEFLKIYPNGVFLPAGLKFDQTVTEVAKQVQHVPDVALGGTLVICTGSGMMAAGVLRGLAERDIAQKVIGVMVHPKSISNLRNFIIKKSALDPFHRIDFKVIDYGYEYTQKEECEVPFPCCPYYDRKAYKFMIDNYDDLKKPVLFWNIGGPYDTKRLNVHMI